jgi:hypothetical protein
MAKSAMGRASPFGFSSAGTRGDFPTESLPACVMPPGALPVRRA